MGKPHDPETCVGCMLNRLVMARYGDRGNATLEQVAELMDDLAHATAHIISAVTEGPMIYNLMLAKHLVLVSSPAPSLSDDIHADMSVRH